MIVDKLADGMETYPRVGMGPTDSILTDTISGTVVGPVGTARACNTDKTDAVRVDGWPVGTLMAMEPLTEPAVETVREGTRIGLAEMR